MGSQELNWQLMGAKAARGELPSTATEREKRQFEKLKQTVAGELDTQVRHKVWREAVRHVRDTWKRHGSRVQTN